MKALCFQIKQKSEENEEKINHHTGGSPVSYLVVGSIPASAAPTTMNPNVIVSDSNYVDGVSPRLKYLSSVFTDMTILGKRADCQGNYTTWEDNLKNADSLESSQ